MNELRLLVTERAQEGEGICSFVLEPVSGGELPPFTAGAHIDVQVHPGIVRQYSLCGDPAERRRWRIAVLREPASRGGSSGMHDEVHPGTTLRVSQPHNHFPCLAASHSMLLAGGIGVTPVLAMAKTLRREGRSFELHYCSRSAARTAFRSEIASAFGANAHFHFDDGDAAQKFDAQAVLSGAHPQTHLYVCGPAGFIDHVLVTARRLGWPEDRLHREYFAAPVAAAQTSDAAFEVRLARSGISLNVPSNKSVLEVLLDAGIEIPFSCESGVCGTCATRVLEGTPEHRDAYFTDAERAKGDRFTPCCSRSKTSTLVIDL
jgi:vanillate monooxygenase ferredoxin subunit